MNIYEAFEDSRLKIIGDNNSCFVSKVGSEEIRVQFHFRLIAQSTRDRSLINVDCPDELQGRVESFLINKFRSGSYKHIAMMKKPSILIYEVVNEEVKSELLGKYA